MANKGLFELGLSEYFKDGGSLPTDKFAQIPLFEVGSCRVILGSMFSGKTVKLNHELATMADIGFRCLYINHEDDVRATESSDVGITSHSSLFKEGSAKVDRMTTGSLSKVDIKDYHVIGVDEAQFFDDLNETVRCWVLQHQKRVIVASLDGDFQMQPFGQVCQLIPICEPGYIDKLAARCMRCMIQMEPYRRVQLLPAGFTARLSASKDQKEVGAKDKYMAVCLKCHQDHTQGQI